MAGNRCQQLDSGWVRQVTDGYLTVRDADSGWSSAGPGTAGEAHHDGASRLSAYQTAPGIPLKCGKAHGLARTYCSVRQFGKGPAPGG